MGSKTCGFEHSMKSVRTVMSGALTSVLALLAFVMCAPQLAFAQDSTQIIDGTMTITLQGGSSGGGAGGESGASATITTSATTTSGGASSASVLTGDTLIWLILGIVVLLAGAVYVIVKSRKLAGMVDPSTGASDDAMTNSTAGTPAVSSLENLSSAKRKTIIVAIVSALVACACFGMFASKSNAFAKEGITSIVGASNVVVDDQGTVISNDLAITNNSGKSILIKTVQAPDELKDWNASIKDEMLDSGSSVQGLWDGKVISSSLLEQIKNSDSSRIALSLKITITDTESSLDFDKFSVETEGLAYNGEQIKPEVTSDIYKQGTDYEVIYGENKNTGEGTVTIKGIGDYKGEKTYTFTIAPKEVSLSWEGQAPYEYEYDGQSHVPSVSVDGVVKGDTVEVAVDGEQINVGSYTATATIDNANYKLSSEAKTTQNFTIAQREASLIWSGDSFTYNGQSQAPTAEAENLIEGDTVNVTVEGAQTNAGTYTATATALDNANYKLPSEVTHSFTINQIELTLTWGAETTFTYNREPHAPSAEITGVIKGDTVNLTIEGEQTNASDTPYTATATIDNANYKLPSINTKDFTIAKADITISGIKANDKTYDGTTKAELNFDQVELAGKVGSDDLGVTAEGTFEDANVGTAKAVTISNLVLGGASVDNYKLAEKGQQTSTTATINQATLDFGKFNVNTDTQTYTAKQIAPTVSGDTYKLSTDYEVTYGENINAGENVGTITINGTGNYKGTKTYTFTINQKELTLTWGDKTTFTYDGVSHVPSATIDGTIKGDTVKLSVEGAQTNASDSPYTATAKIDNKNYKLPTDNTKEFTITRAEITVSGITAKDKTYDGTTAVDFDYTDVKLDGKVNGDDLSVSAEGAFEYAGVGAGKTVNITDLTLEGTSANNYKLASTGQQTSTTATINQAALDFTRIEVMTKVVAYTGQQIKPEVTSSIYTEDVDFEVIYGRNINAGEGRVTIIGIGNYTGEELTTFTITRANPNPTIPEGLTAETGQTLADIVLPKQTEPVPGTFAWEAKDPSAVPVGEAGTTPTFNAIFTPKDTNNYNTQVVAVPITVTNAKTAFAVLFADNTLGFYNRVDIPKENESFDKKTVSAVYKNIENANYKPEWLEKEITSATVVDAGIQPKSTANWFALSNPSSLTKIDVSKLNTVKTTSMASMFKGCSVLTTVGDLSNWSTAQVSDMSSMFEGCSALAQTGDISGWNTSQVTTMASMFKDCKALTTVGDISAWYKNTASVTDMTSMFENCENLTADCFQWTVDNVEDRHEGFNTNAPHVHSPWGDPLIFDNFKVDTEAKTYTASQITPSVTCDTYQQGTDYEVVYGENLNVGVGTITIKGLNKYKGAKTYTFTIEQKELTLVWAEQTAFDYDGNTHAPSATIEGIIGSDAVNLTIKGEQTNAGTYVALAKIDNENYKLPAENKKSFIIARAQVSVIGITAKSKTYDGTTKVEFDCTKAIFVGKLPNDELTVKAEGAFENANAGTNKTVNISNLVLRGKSADNYKLAKYGQQTSANADINTVSINPDNIIISTEGTTYTGEQLKPAVTIKGLKLNRDYAVYYGGNINAGENAGTVRIEGIGSYSGSFEKTFDIAKADPICSEPIYLTAEEGQTLADLSLPYQTEPVAGTLTWIYKDPSKVSVGAAGTTPTFGAVFTPADTDNYNIKEGVYVNLTVTKAKEKKAFAVYFAEDKSLNFYKRADIPNVNDVFDGKKVTEVYTGIETSNYADSSAPWVGNPIATATVVDKGIHPKSTAKWFYNGSPVVRNKLTKVDAKKLDTSKTIDMTQMFWGCRELTEVSGISSWDTSNVESMSATFLQCPKLTADCSAWNVEKVGESAHEMFNENAPGVISPWTDKIAFAVYSETDLSLNFYKRLANEIPTAGDTFDGRTATEVYTGIETDVYTAESQPPWKAHQYDIEKTTVVDEGIAPVSMRFWFRYDLHLIQVDISKLNTAKITNMDGLFTGTRIATIDLSNLNTSRVTSMGGMFDDCVGLTSIKGLQNWDTSNVENMGALFANCYRLKDIEGISHWDTSNVTSMSYMFYKVESLETIDISDFDMSKVEDVSDMFSGSYRLTSLDLSSWNLSSVKTMSYMFKNCWFLESLGGIDWWNTSNVIYMNHVFERSSHLREDCSHWDVSKVEDDNHVAFNEDAPYVKSPWDKSLVFENFKVDTDTKTYSGERIKPEITCSEYVLGTDYKVTYGENKNAGEGTITIEGIGNYKGEKTYVFAISKAVPSYTAPQGLSVEVGQTLADATLPKQTTPIAGTFTWNDPTIYFNRAGVGTFKATFTPDDTANYSTVENIEIPVTVTKEKVGFAVYFADGNALNFYNRAEDQIPSVGDTFDGKTVSAVYKDVEKADYKDSGAPWKDKNITTATVVDTGIQPISMAKWFADAKALTAVDVSKLETINTTDLSSMFKGCGALTSVGDISQWNTAKVSDMSSMFEGCSAIESVGDISGWDTANATNMTGTFKDCAKLLANCFDWDVEKVGEIHTDFDTGAPGVQSPWDKRLDFNKFEVDTADQTYTASKITPSVRCNAYKQGSDYEVIYGENLNAGENAGTITIRGLNEYKEEKTYTFTIAPKELPTTWLGDKFTYNGKAQVPSAHITDVIQGDTVNVAVDGAQTDAGFYIATATIDNPNYVLSASNKFYYITRATVTVSGIKAQSKVYDGSTDVVLDCSSIVLDGKVKDDDLAVSVEGNFADQNAQTGKQVNIKNLTLTGSSSINYELASEGQQTTTTADITPRMADIEWGETSFTYNASMQMPHASVKNAVQGDTVDVLIKTSTEECIDVGTYEATPSALTNANYALPQISAQTFYITQAPLSITGIRANVKTYNGDTTASIDHTNITLSGIKGNDNVSALAKGTYDDANAGDNKNITIEYTLYGKEKDNYKLDTETSTMTLTGAIDPAYLDNAISVSPQGHAYTGSQVAPAVWVQDLELNKDYILVYGENINVGTQAGIVYVRGIGNYTGTQKRTFDITKGDPSYTLPQMLIAQEGDTLSNIALPAQENGTLAWNNPSQSVGTQGGHTFTATFTPNDTNNYNVIENIDINVQVNSSITAFAVYSKTDNSLSFYKRSGMATAGEDFNGKEATAVYTGFETDRYDSSFAPWAGDAIKTVTVVDDNIHPVSTARWFVSKKASTLETVDMAKLDTSRTTDMTLMFDNCQNLTSANGLSKWDTRNVTSLNNLFANCLSLNSVDDLSAWNTSKVVKMRGAFLNCSNLTMDCSQWNIESVTQYASFNSNAPNVISPWDEKTAFAVYSETDNSLNFYKRVKVPTERSEFDGKIATAVYTGIEENAYEITTVPWTQKAPFIKSSKVVDEGIAPVSTAWWFYDCSNLTSANVSKLDTSNVTNMMAMFYFTKVATLDLSNFNTSNVTNMRAMFGGCQNLTSINGLEKWDTGNVTEMAYMFSHCSNLSSVSVSGFNTKNVTTMEGIFNACSNLSNLDLSRWDVSSVKNLSASFQNCNSLVSVGDLSGWNTGNVTDMPYTFQNCSILSLDCSRWSVDSVAYGKHPGFNEDAPEVVSPWDTRTSFAVYCADDGSLRFYNDRTTNMPQKGDSYKGRTVTAVYTNLFEESYSDKSVPWVEYRNSIKSVTVVDRWISPNGMQYWFSGLAHLASIDVAKLDTSHVKDMSNTFEGTVGLESLDLSGWDTSNVKFMYCTFRWSTVTSTSHLKGLNLSSVESMEGMYSGCGNLETADLSGIDTPKLTNISGMFQSANLTSFNFSHWNISQVTNISSMFRKCPNLQTGDFTGWDTSNVTTMAYMFEDATAIKSFDMRGFNTSKVTNMAYMFAADPLNLLETITGNQGNVLNWDVSNVTNMNLMFFENRRLDLNCSNWNVSKYVAHELFRRNADNITPPNWKNASWLDFNNFSVDTGNQSYTGKQITPTVTSSKYREGIDYEVIYGENIELGKGTITINDKGDYVGNKTYTFNIVKGVPSYTVPQNLTLIEGQTLADVALPKQTEPVAGTFIWDNPTIYPEEGGVQTFKATFIPDDLEHFHSVENIDIPVNVRMKISFAVYSADNNSLNFYKRLDIPIRGGYFEGNIVTAIYKDVDKNEYDYDTIPWGDRRSDITSVKVADEGIAPKRMSYWFNDCTALTSVDVAKLNTSNVTDMYKVFCNSGITSLDLSNWDTSTVADMGAMFANCSNLTSIGGISDWATLNVEDMGSMFCGCKKLSANCARWDIDKVGDNHAFFNEDASGVVSPWGERTAFAIYSAEDGSLNFYKDAVAPAEGSIYRDKVATKVYANIENTAINEDQIPWNDIRADIKSVEVVDKHIMPTSTAHWFSNCINLTALNVSRLDTSQDANMWGMFYGIKLTELDLSNFDTSKATNMMGMFADSSNLTAVVGLSDWNTSNVENMHGMFYNCSKLEADCSGWNKEKVGDNHADFNTGAPGVKSPWDGQEVAVASLASNEGLAVNDGSVTESESGAKDGTKVTTEKDANDSGSSASASPSANATGLSVDIKENDGVESIGLAA